MNAGLPALPVFPADPVVEGLQVYVVGGAVRDALLGLPAGDCDWVVVGATPELMVSRGFTPVGGDFPVFLHPVTHEEYALARTERKSGRGYQGFTFYTGPEVTLADDLKRRDLTVNAIAQTRSGALVDPLNGLADIKARVLRHVGDAFVEDPVRLLRLARFAARFTGFSIAPETFQLACRMVADGEVDALVPERVWREISKGLMSDCPERMFQLLDSTGALARILPGFSFDDGLYTRLACAVVESCQLPARFALAVLASPSPESLARHLKAPSEVVDFARLLPLMVQALACALSPPVVLGVIERLDGLRKPERFEALVKAAACARHDATDVEGWLRCLDVVRGVDAGKVAKECAGRATDIKAAVRQAREDALTAFFTDGHVGHPG